MCIENVGLFIYFYSKFYFLCVGINANVLLFVPWNVRCEDFERSKQFLKKKKVQVNTRTHRST